MILNGLGRQILLDGLGGGPAAPAPDHPGYPSLGQKPDLPLSPDGDREDAVLRSQFEGGYELTRRKFTRARRSWGSKYSMLPKRDVDTLRVFEDGAAGAGAGLFQWVHPLTGQQHLVRLTAPIKYGTEIIGHDGVTYSTVEFTVREA